MFIGDEYNVVIGTSNFPQDAPKSGRVVLKYDWMPSITVVGMLRIVSTIRRSFYICRKANQPTESMSTDGVALTSDGKCL